MVCLVGRMQRRMCLWRIFTQSKFGEVSCIASTGYWLPCEMFVFEEEQSEGSESKKKLFITVIALLADGSILKSADVVVLKTCYFVADTKFLGEEVVLNTKKPENYSNASYFCTVSDSF